MDPGTVDFGICIMEVDDLGVVEDIWTTNVNAYNIHRGDIHRDMPKEDMDARERTLYIMQTLTSVIKLRKPDVAAVESPFANPRMIHSFAILSRHFKTIEDTMKENRVHMYAYAPASVKAGFKCAGKKGKMVMRDALAEMDHLTTVMSKDLDQMTEHEIDAVAVCTAHLNKAIKGALE